ncbi:LysR substrate-binding domain-containing protein [Pararhizobium mangrovi]|uniref:HTH-type transcriptional regulator TtuA n=1 Tax=Pararhizobium mangrovi TaxID=2590452 RepID=A0A506U5W3_9HYPH|nr:LysR substrate-binding domain-containing protein [Pararhizobium mangrovi]TPW27327.1 LysR family transcriptional regulator [Pararhizobium mangrovi]
MVQSLDSDLLRVFLAVAECGAFTGAGEVVGRTQSAVSMQVRRLEDQLGETLFVRGPRGVTLTAKGEQLLPYARRITGLMSEATAALRTPPLAGRLRVGIPEEYGERILPRLLAAFAERHPAVEVTVRCDHSVPQLKALERDELDLAVVFEWNQSELDEVLAVDPTVWVTSMAYRQHEHRPLPIAIYNESSWCTDFAIRSLEQHTIEHRVAYTCETCGGLNIAVATGLAVAALARSTIPPGCRELTSTDGFPTVDSSRVVLKRSPYHSTEAAEGMAAMLREAFAPVPETTEIPGA